MLDTTLLLALTHSSAMPVGLRAAYQQLARTSRPAQLLHTRHCTCLLCSDLLSDEQDEQDRADRECDEQDDADIDFVRGMAANWAVRS